LPPSVASPATSVPTRVFRLHFHEWGVGPLSTSDPAIPSRSPETRPESGREVSPRPDRFSPEVGSGGSTRIFLPRPQGQNRRLRAAPRSHGPRPSSRRHGAACVLAAWPTPPERRPLPAPEGTSRAAEEPLDVPGQLHPDGLALRLPHLREWAGGVIHGLEP